MHIMTKDGWKPIHVANCRPAPKDPTILDALGIRPSPMSKEDPTMSEASIAYCNRLMEAIIEMREQRIGV